jgi:hypothetical protein
MVVVSAAAQREAARAWLMMLNSNITDWPKTRIWIGRELYFMGIWDGDVIRAAVERLRSYVRMAERQELPHPSGDAGPSLDWLVVRPEYAALVATCRLERHGDTFELSKHDYWSGHFAIQETRERKTSPARRPRSKLFSKNTAKP